MHNFVWSAKDSTGRRVIKEVPAETAQESRMVLEAAGFTELELQEDEIMAAAVSGHEKPASVFGEEVRVTAADRAKARADQKKSRPRRILETIWQDRGLYLIVIIFAGFQFYKGNRVAGGLICVAALAWPGFRIWMGLPGYYYRKLNLAKDWHRWDEVLSVVEKIEGSNRFHFIKLPESELIRARAQAYAGTGRLAEGLEEMTKLEGNASCPSWLYKAFIAGIYDIAKQHDAALEYTVASIQEHASSSIYFDLANRLLRYKRDPLRGRQALAEAEKGEVTEVALPFKARCHGILAYLEGDFAGAIRELGSSLAIMDRNRTRPFWDGSVNIARGYLCCAQARGGDFAAAKKTFAAAREYLEATNETELLAECKNLVGAV